VVSVAELRTVAGASGLVALGVCRAEPFPDVARDLTSRRDDGLSAGMAFTFAHPELSSDVTASFPWARRLVVGAWSYLVDSGSPGSGEPGSGRIARFATADHYRGLTAGLEAVAGALRNAGQRTAVLVDDNRLVDRAAAVRAGIGWWGKSTLVLSPGHGPWLLLGSIVTDAALPVDEPMVRDCGTCDACIPACPTGAIVAPGVLDARRCLAYWAQAPGVIPKELRPSMGDRIYGCDDCLDACPPGHRARNAAPAGVGRVDLLAVLAAADAELVRRFGHFYFPGRRPRTLRRNAIVALANTARGEPWRSRATSVLAGYAGHPDWLLRAHAVWGLHRLGGTASRAVLQRRRRRERHPAVLAELGGTGAFRQRNGR
jgi:epoxyqueuosine reductase